jgi:release factor glutamine methyltransferase
MSNLFVDNIPGTYVSGSDSQLLRRVAMAFSGEICLEIGVGSGSNMLELCRSFTRVCGTDIIRTQAFEVLRDGDLVVTDAGSCFRNGTFDLVLFNPPYLPSSEIQDPAVDGGDRGIEVAIRFLLQAKKLINSRGKIIVILSSLGSISDFESVAKKQGLSVEVIDSFSLFFEQLHALLLSRTP